MYQYRRRAEVLTTPIHLSRFTGNGIPGSSTLHRRAISSNNISTIVVLAILSAIIIATFIICLLRSVRRRHRDPKYIPTPFLKRLWTQWRVPSSQTYQPTSHDDSTDASSDRRGSRQRVGSATFENSAEQPSQRGSETRVDRNTSVRSIMTLPAYRQTPATTEQVLGREGERDGVDVVIELPTAEDHEAMREGEMDALYQIRLARREQIADREERRRLRREARDRNDTVALEELRSRARAASNNTLLEELRRDHDRAKEQRQRAVSSVSYADLGVARHDGTRLRANSTESERVGLLSDTASIGAISTLSGGASSHRRNRSGSVLSMDSDMPSPGLPRSRASSRAETPRLSVSHTRAGSSPELIEADLGDSDMPPHSPPGYDEVSLDDARSGATTPHNEPPPDYPGPTRSREPRESWHSADLGAENRDSDNRGRRHSRRGVDGIAPQLPSLRLQGLPQIVIEPHNEQRR